MMQAGVYGELEKMDELMKQFYHVRAADPKKVPFVAAEIYELAESINMLSDISITPEEMLSSPEGCVKRLHSWMANIQSSAINDGFHILGQVPQGDKLRNMAQMLVRNRNGSVASIRDSACELLGYSYDTLLSALDTPTEDGRSYAMLLKQADSLADDILLELEKSGYADSAVDSIIEKFAGPNTKNARKLKECLHYACTFIMPRIEKITDEIEHLADGLNGRFIAPGPSGCPTRGNAQILPTGRNFYTIDPGAMPSRAAWEVGITLADQLIERYTKDSGEFPESVTVLVYATEAMRNYGDDIAETFYLLGVRTVWLGETDRIIGVQAIPLEELGRPRIDVTLRITGLFRDAFPNLIERVEDAVNLVASLDERAEDNFIRKHVEEDIAELVEKGMNIELAYERSLLRVFGDAPGAYGAGVNWIVQSQKWSDTTDLGNAYTTWGSHAYSKKYHGEKMPELFSIRMRKTSVAVKNESSREFDLLDGDDFYNYFGGMVAAITTHSGSQKPAYIPSTADVDHIETLTLHEEMSRVMRAKIDNPKWVEGLKKHGYRGASQISGMVDYAFGWDATTGVVDEWMYDSIAERYAFDEQTAFWMREVNPWALHNVAERLLEAHQRGMWNASDDKVGKLRDICLEMEAVMENI